MRRLRNILLSIVLVIVVAIAAFALWAHHAMGPQPTAYAAARADNSVVIADRGDFITIRPSSSQSTIGLLFYPGLRVAPEAYVAKLAAIAAAANIQIVIGRPVLNIAAFSVNQADSMRNALPGVTHWYVGGHSLGGAMACLYASKHASRLEGVVLLGTYCGSDISKTQLRVLDVTGENDGVIPTAKIIDHEGEMPKGTTITRIPGMNHGQMGNYREQSGDHAASISDDDAKHMLVGAVKKFFESLQPVKVTA